MDESRWYARMRDIPKMRYEAPITIDRDQLPKHSLKPKIYTYDLDGVQRKSLSWDTRDGSTSRSPALEWMSFEWPNAENETLIRRIYEALELPGTASDYHFALRAHGELAGRARRHPTLLAELERLCLLDVALLEAVPDVTKLGSAPSFGHLISLYERNGFLDNALAIARRGELLGQCKGEVARLTERIALLEAEPP